ncbi:MAG: bifunctional ornithine acetyltransferase/N-acetylglutamate synthase [Marinilabiliales bacterium]|nr:bifunctional ornithine acetyltransferase/N-acetylglutamate synthase [Marinilabiliales bacterium]
MVGAEGIMTTDTYQGHLPVRGERHAHGGGEGLGDDRAQHGHHAGLRLHRRGVGRRRAGPGAAQGRGPDVQPALRGHRHQHLGHVRPHGQRPGRAPWARTRSGEALLEAFTRMTEMLARDGEGATVMLRVTVTGAADAGEARTVAKSLVNSPLVKTMVFGGDPERGADPDGGGEVLRVPGGPGPHRREDLRRGRPGGRAQGRVRRGRAADAPAHRPRGRGGLLGMGEGQARAWGCDLTHGYVDENACLLLELTPACREGEPTRG